MSDVAEIKAELSGNTNFDEEHENELFERIAEIEDQESKGELVKELTKTDYIIIALLFIAFGIVPVIWYAVI
jgi:chorismate mutase